MQIREDITVKQAVVFLVSVLAVVAFLTVGAWLLDTHLGS